MKNIMTPHNKRWNVFASKLEGPTGCNFRRDNKGQLRWNCKSGNNKQKAIKILKQLGNIDIIKTIKYFDNHGGYCDCEILFNVAAGSKYDKTRNGKKG